MTLPLLANMHAFQVLGSWGKLGLNSSIWPQSAKRGGPARSSWRLRPRDGLTGSYSGPEVLVKVPLEEVIGDRRKMLKPPFTWPPVLPLNSNSISAVNVVLLVGSAGIK